MTIAITTPTSSAAPLKKEQDICKYKEEVLSTLNMMDDPVVVSDDEGENPRQVVKKQAKTLSCQDAMGDFGQYRGNITTIRTDSNIPMFVPHTTTTTSDDDDDDGEENIGVMEYEHHDMVRKYSGPWHLGYWHGPGGTCELKSGDVYTGSFQYQQRHGKGTYTWALESLNTIDSNDKNKSKLLFKQRIYKGDFAQNQPHGHGTYLWNTLRLEVNDDGDDDDDDDDNHKSANLDYRLVSQTKYIGQFEKGQRKGHGRYQDPNSNTTYAGDWHQGKYHGYGVLEQEQEQPGETITHTYKGHFEHGRRHGQGIETITTTNHDAENEDEKKETTQVRHDGMWHENHPVVSTPTTTTPAPGSHQTAMPSSTVLATPQPCQDAAGRNGYYKGILENGCPEGVGTMTYDNINHNLNDNDNDDKDQMIILSVKEYEGFWQAGHYHGFGRLQYHTGSWFQGNFKSSLPHGPGEYHQTSNYYKGTLEHGRFHGPNTTVVYDTSNGGKNYDGGNILYQGSYHQGQRHGQGQITFPNGGYYKGNFENGKYHTTTTATDAKNQRGTLVTAETMYEGPFQNGLYHGESGTLTLLSSDIILFQGAWENGKPVIPPDNNNDIDNDQTTESKATSNNIVWKDDYQKYLENIPQPPVDDPDQIFNGGRATPKNKNTPKTPAAAPSPSVTKTTTPRMSPHASHNDHNDSTVSSLSSFTTSIWASMTGVPHSTPVPTSSVKEREDDECKAVVNQKVVDGQGNAGLYTGLLLVAAQQPHGVGRMVYADGNRIHEGFWQYGHRQGHGRCLFVQIGDFHEGNYEKNLRHGKGAYVWKDGRQYHGDYDHDERHGYGTFRYPNGDIYTGQFSHGLRHGHGKFVFGPNSTKDDKDRNPPQSIYYQGQWEKNVYHGPGKLEWKQVPPQQPSEEQPSQPPPQQLHLYDGEFFNGKFHGLGVERVDGRVTRQGVWQDGQLLEPLMDKEAFSKALNNVMASCDMEAVSLEESAAKDDAIATHTGSNGGSISLPSKNLGHCTVDSMDQNNHNTNNNSLPLPPDRSDSLQERPSRRRNQQGDGEHDDPLANSSEDKKSHPELQ